MQRIPDGQIDAVICDLPYGSTSCAWDSVIPFEPLWEQYHRVCKPDAAIVLFGSGMTALACIRENRNFIGFEVDQECYAKACEIIGHELEQPKLL